MRCAHGMGDRNVAITLLPGESDWCPICLRAEVARLRLDLDAYEALEKLARDLGFANIATVLDSLEVKGDGI